MASITKHKDQWRVFIRRSKDGQTYSKSKLLPTKQEAQRWARAQEHQLDNIVHVPVGLRLTFADLVDEYQLHTNKGGRTKQQAVRAIREALGVFRLSELSTPVFMNYVRQRASSGAGPATIGTDLAFVSSLIRHGSALKGAHEAAAPALAALNAARFSCRHAGLVGPSQERTRRPTDEELRKLKSRFATWRGKTPMWEIISFAVATAMRLSEICRITWGDIDETDRTVVIRDRKHPNQKKGNDQIIPLLSGHTTLLGEPLSAWGLVMEQKKSLPEEYNQQHLYSMRVFPVVSQSVTVIFREATAALGIVDLHFHDLRHEGVSRLFEAGYTIEQTALVSGHKDWKQLKRYTQIKPASLHRDQHLGGNKVI